MGVSLFKGCYFQISFIFNRLSIGSSGSSIFLMFLACSVILGCFYAMGVKKPPEGFKRFRQSHGDYCSLVSMGIMPTNL